MYHLLYRVTNSINDKFYIGVHSTENKEDGYMGSGKFIKKAIKKYGKENFTKEILAILPDRQTSLDIERHIVGEKMIKREDCYNIVIGGQKGVGRGENHPLFGIRGEDHPLYGTAGPMKGKSHSEETKEKMREWHKNNVTPMSKMIGKKNHFYGKKHTEETKRKMSENHADVSGENNPAYGRDFSHTKESKRKLSESLKGKMSGSENPMAKKIINTNTGKIYGTLKEAAKDYDKTAHTLCHKMNHDDDFTEFKKL